MRYFGTFIDWFKAYTKKGFFHCAHKKMMQQRYDTTTTYDANQLSTMQLLQVSEQCIIILTKRAQAIFMPKYYRIVAIIAGVCCTACKTFKIQLSLLLVTYQRHQHLPAKDPVWILPNADNKTINAVDIDKLLNFKHLQDMMMITLVKRKNAIANQEKSCLCTYAIQEVSLINKTTIVKT